MVRPWTPELRLETVGTDCRLILVGVTCGDGPTLQEAASDLVARLTRLAVGLRSARFRLPSEIGPLDGRMLFFLWEVTEMVARGEDIRGRALGYDAERDPTP